MGGSGEAAGMSRQLLVPVGEFGGGIHFPGVLWGSFWGGVSSQGCFWGSFGMRVNSQGCCGGSFWGEGGSRGIWGRALFLGCSWGLTRCPPGWSRDLHGAPRAIRQALPRLHHQHLCLRGAPSPFPWDQNPLGCAAPSPNAQGAHNSPPSPVEFHYSSALTLCKGSWGALAPALGRIWGAPLLHKGLWDPSASPKAGRGSNTTCPREGG